MQVAVRVSLSSDIRGNLPAVRFRHSGPAAQFSVRADRPLSATSLSGALVQAVVPLCSTFDS